MDEHQYCVFELKPLGYDFNERWTSLTVKQLVEQLQELPPDALVFGCLVSRYLTVGGGSLMRYDEKWAKLRPVEL